MSNLASLFAFLLANRGTIESAASTLINMLAATTAATPTTVPATPTTPAVERRPDPTVKELQEFLNLLPLGLPPLVADGWMGKKTAEAFHAAVALIKPYLGALGK